MQRPILEYPRRGNADAILEALGADAGTGGLDESSDSEVDADQSADDDGDMCSNPPDDEGG